MVGLCTVEEMIRGFVRPESVCCIHNVSYNGLHSVKPVAKLTIMVNNVINVSAYMGQPPAQAGDERTHIVGGPLYPVADVLQLLEAGDDKTTLCTRKCIQDVARLDYEIAEVRQLIRQAITEGHYLNSEWCLQQPTGPWAACDSYCLQRSEWVEYAHKDMRFEYYVKFAIGKTGQLLLLVSCHMSQ